MADYSAYGPWVGGDDWRAWVGVYITTNNETTLAGRIESWVWSEYGTTSGYSNIRGAAAWDGNSWSYGSNTSISTNSWKKLKEVTFSVAKGHSATSDYAWARAEGVSGTYSGSSSEVKVKVSIPAKKSYTVSYNANGHGTAPSAQTKWHGETLQLRGAISATGYTFRGWNTKADGSGTSYSAGGNYTANAAVTLYAQWQAATYTITPNANGGTLKSGCTALTKTYGVNLTLWVASLNPTRTGYTFLGWSTSSTATSATYAAGATYSANAAATLYAVWQVETYTVSYNGNAPVGTATNVPSAQSKTYNVTLVLSSVEPMLSGYSFLGWGTSSSATTPTYQPGGNYTNNAAATLYAIWGNTYEPPAIFDLAVVRSDGTQDSDDGTRCHVSLGWSVDPTDGGQIGSVTVGYKVRNSSGDYTTETASVTGTTTGTADVILSGTFALNTAYDIKVTVTDNHGTSAIKTSVLSISYFTLDFLAGGTGIAIGKAATRDGLDVAMPAYFSGGNVQVEGTDPAPVILCRNLTHYGKAGADVPTANEVYARPMRVYDASNSTIAYSELVKTAADDLYLSWAVQRAKTDNTTVVNGLYLHLDANGARSVTVSDAAPWRTMLNHEDTNWVYLVGNSSTNRVRYRKKAGIVFVDVWYESSAGLSTTAKTMATLPAGFRPDVQIETAAFGNVNQLVMLRVNPGGSIVAKVMSGTTNYLKGIISFPV